MKVRKKYKLQFVNPIWRRPANGPYPTRPICFVLGSGKHFTDYLDDVVQLCSQNSTEPQSWIKCRQTYAIGGDELPNSSTVSVDGTPGEIPKLRLGIFFRTIL